MYNIIFLVSRQLCNVHYYILATSELASYALLFIFISTLSIRIFIRYSIPTSRAARVVKPYTIYTYTTQCNNN